MSDSPEAVEADVVLVGGGLVAGLAALRLKALRPQRRVVLLEREGRIGGEHTWCCFATDVSAEIAGWLSPLCAHEWRGYDVRFPGYSRALSTTYRAITSERLHAAVSGVLGDDAWLSVEADEVRSDRVRLVDGRRLSAPLVIDARGPRRSDELVLAWQKFLGREVRLGRPHGLERPVVMDAEGPQLDGYRFMYLLPMAKDRLLIEDTRYSDTPALDRVQVGAEIDDYARGKGWTIVEEVRRETGVLPIALAGDIDAFWREAGIDGGADAGMRAALFHPTTGYSLPDAARQAEAIAGLPHLATAPARAAIEAMSKRAWRERAYHRLLNRMLFRGARPEERWRVLARFYRLPQALIERFYAAQSTAADKARILLGRPPVPIGRALAAVSETALLAERRRGAG